MEEKKTWDSLTDFQQKLYTTLLDNQSEPLTLRQMAGILGVSSHNSIIHHLKQLEKKGYIRKNEDGKIDIFKSPIKDIMYINMYGICRCGKKGFFNDDNILERIPLPAKTLKLTTDSFLVKAQGKSMEPMIYNGDLIVAQKTNSCDNKDTIIVVYNDESFIKKIAFNYKKNKIALLSLNNKFRPIIIHDPKKLKIIGIITNIIHY